MQNEIYSYTFPLFEHAYNAFIASFKNKHLLIAGPQPHQHSLINLFSYEDQNLKKSAGLVKKIEGKITNMIAGEQVQKQIALIVAERQNQNHVLSVDIGQFSGQNEEICSTIHSQADPILSIALKGDLSGLFMAGRHQISLLDLEKREIVNTFGHQAKNIEHLGLDPNFQMLTYVSEQKQIIICDKKTQNEKYAIKGPAASDILSIDYNPNKQYCLMTCHHESIKFWDIRRGAIPFKTYDDHHNLLTQARYNHSHDELIACGYDDGSVGLLRLVSASSSMQGDSEDALVRLYDQHQDSVLRLQWAHCSPWVFASVSCKPSMLVLNIVPNAEKYRILL